MTSDWHRSQEPPGIGDERQLGRVRVRRGAGKGPNWRILIGSAALLCVTTVGVSLAAFSATGAPVVQGQAGSQASKSPAAALGVTAPAAPAAPGGDTIGSSDVRSDGIAKTALQWPSALTDQIRRWAAGSGGAAWSAVTTQLANATQVGGLKLYAQLKASCANLGSSVQTAQSAPPIPDNAMQRLYASALSGLSTSAADCRGAVSVRQVGDEDQEISVNNALLNRSLAELAAGSKQLYTATAEIRPLRG